MNNLVRQEENYPKLRAPTTILDHVERGVEGGGAPILVTVALHRDGGAKGSLMTKGQGCVSRPLLFHCPWRPCLLWIGTHPTLGCSNQNETKWATKLELTGGQAPFACLR
jgi:hypothetical protein